jgi:hypothetical protein
MDCTINARLLFVGLWNFADDNGNIEAHPRKIKAHIYPSDGIKVEPLLKELIDHNFIIPYSVNNKKYLNIRTFLTHQKIDKPSKLPKCPLFTESSTNTPRVLPVVREGKGGDSKVKEGNSKVQEGEGNCQREGETSFEEDVEIYHQQQKLKEKRKNISL